MPIVMTLALLYPLAQSQRSVRRLGVTDQPVFFGADLWTAYELSWLNMREANPKSLWDASPCQVRVHPFGGEQVSQALLSTVSTTAVFAESLATQFAK
jgi:hypothetical protein